MDDPGGHLEAARHDCAEVVESAQSFGFACGDGLDSLSGLFSLVGIVIPPEMATSRVADLCPVTCHACGPPPDRGNGHR